MHRGWMIPRIWSGPCAILASGESMSRAVADQVRAAGIRTIAINTTWRLARWADLLYAADAPWWTMYHAEVAGAGFGGLKVCAEETPYQDVLHIEDSGKEGFDDNPAAIRSGGNGGYGGAHIAIHLGCDPILLCGFDMKGGHWHGRHPEPLRDAGEGIFPRWIARFETLARELAKRDKTVLNCTPGSALRCFPMIQLEDALAGVLSAA